MMKKRKFLLSILFAFIATVSFAQTVAVWKLKDLQAAMQDAKEPTIINFWATFCKPCIEELPHFQTLAHQYKSKGVKLIAVSLDLQEMYPAKIASFAKRLKLTSSVAWLNESNADLFCPAVDSSWSGAIPATLFINNKKAYRQFFEEELDSKRLEAEIKKMVGE